jgi:hypothetical protein
MLRGVEQWAGCDAWGRRYSALTAAMVKTLLAAATAVMVKTLLE